MAETHAKGAAVGSFRLDEANLGEKASPVDGGRNRVRFLHRLVPEQVGPPLCPIMLRWTLLGGDGISGWRLMLHRFPPMADDRDPHDHPCDFWTLVLAGGYDDLTRTDRPIAWRCSGCGFSTVNGELAHKHRCIAPPRFRDVQMETTYAYDVEPMRRGSFRRRRAEHRHVTKAGSGGCWSLVVMAPKRREWGFWRDGKSWPWRTYEKVFGFGMRCE